MTDQYLSSGLRAWLKDTEARPDDARRSTDAVMARVEQAGQRGRWWPLPTFERPVSTFPTQERAPVPIPATIGSTAAEPFTMSSALKFMVAGVIVALFGGFLLAGVFTTQQSEEVPPAAVTASPTTEAKDEARTSSVRTDILPGVELTVEEVEPGLYRVLHDGKHRLFRGWALTTGMDGSIWGIQDGGFFRVGGPTYQWPQHIKYIEQFEVALDGTAWVLSAGPTLDDRETAERDKPTIRSFDGGTWTFGKRGENLRVGTVPDGTVWARWDGRSGPVLARWSKDGWQRFDAQPPEDAGDVFIASNGDMWAASWSDNGELHRLVDGTWQPLGPSVADVDVGADGTIWALQQPEVQVVEGGDPDDWADFVTDDEGNWVFDYVDILMRFDGSEWQEWGPADGVPAGLVGLRAAPDGSLWATAGAESCDGGMFHFDGTTWSHYLAGLCTDVFEVAPDGSLWAVDGAEDTDGVRLADLYVITPEAVASTE